MGLAQLNEMFKKSASGFPSLDDNQQVKFIRQVIEHPSLNELDNEQLKDLTIEAIVDGNSYMVLQCALDLVFTLEEKNILPDDSNLINVVIKQGIHAGDIYQDKTLKLVKRLIESGNIDDRHEIKDIIVTVCDNRNTSGYIKASAIDLIPVAISSGVLFGGNHENYNDNDDMAFLNNTLGRIEYEMATGKSLRSYNNQGRFIISEHIKEHGFEELPSHSKSDISNAIMGVRGIDDSLVEDFIDNICPPVGEQHYDFVGDSIRSRWNGIKNTRDANAGFESKFEI